MLLSSKNCVVLNLSISCPSALKNLNALTAIIKQVWTFDQCDWALIHLLVIAFYLITIEWDLGVRAHKHQGTSVSVLRTVVITFLVVKGKNIQKELTVSCGCISTSFRIGYRILRGICLNPLKVGDNEKKKKDEGEGVVGRRGCGSFTEEYCS